MSTIAIIGGSGPEGRGLALRFAIAGHAVIIGSRDAGRAQEAAAKLLEVRAGLPITGDANAPAAGAADTVILSVPFEGLAATVRDLAPQLAGKLVISVVAPFTFENGSAIATIVTEGSAAELVRDLLPTARVASAFHNLSARDLLKPELRLEGDVGVCADDAGTRAETIALADQVGGMRGVDAGTLVNSRYLEELTALLVNLNKIHKAHATVRFVGL
ncbi:MAG: NADPH-dependent F420 reductase [Chloroflexota bacterium]